MGDVFEFDAIYGLIIEFVPLIVDANEGVVVAWLRCAWMHDDGF